MKKRIIYYIIISIFVFIQLLSMMKTIIIQHLEEMLKIYNIKQNYHDKLSDTIGYSQKYVTAYKMFDNIPIIEKDIIKQNYKLFFSKNNYNNRLTFLEDMSGNNWSKNKYSNMNLFHFLHTSFSVLFLKGCIPSITGGSSGNYFYQWYNLKDVWHGGYSFVRGWFNMGWRPGDSILFYYLHGAVSIKLLNFLPIVDVLIPELNDNHDITINSCMSLIHTINTKKIDLLVTFPSFLYRICEYIYSKNITLEHHPKYIDVSADFLFNCQYQFIKSIFYKSDIRMTYGTVEFGQIAQQIPNELFIYEVYPEVAFVENKNNEIVVTSFINTVVPLLRYNTKDKGYVFEKNNTQYIKNLVGKQTHNYDYIQISNILDEINKDYFNIINCKIIHNQKTIIITALHKQVNISLLEDIFPDFNFKINYDCFYTNEKYNRKVTPIIDDFIEKFNF